MHIISLGYPDAPTYADKRAAKDFFNAVPYLLPCPVCKTHFREIISALPVESWLDNRASLVDWVWMVHNQANRRLQKPEIGKEEFMERYKEMAERGLPIPPSGPSTELSDVALRAAWIRGASQTVGALAVVVAVGGLLWASYKTK